MARTISIRLSVEDADRVKQVLQSVGATGEQAFSAFERGATRGAQSFQRLEQSLDPVAAAQARFATAQAQITRAVETGATTQARAAELTDLARQRYLGLSEAVARTGAAHARASEVTELARRRLGALDEQTARTGAASGRFGAAMGQAGFQVQDFATQVSMGQNALVAFSTQFAQFAGFFGVGGAIAGAVVTVGVLAAQFLGVATNANAFEEAMRRQSDALDRLQDDARRYREGLSSEQRTVRELTEQYRSLSNARQSQELRTFRRDQQNFETQRTTFEGRVLGRLGGFSQGIENQIFETEQLAARNYGRGSPEFSAIVGNEDLSRLRQAREAIEAFRATGDVSREALARLYDQLRATADGSDLASRSMRRWLTQMEGLIPQSRDLEDAQAQLNQRAQALGLSFDRAADNAQRLTRALQDLARERDAVLGGVDIDLSNLEGQVGAARRGREPLQAERDRQGMERRFQTELDRYVTSVQTSGIPANQREPVINRFVDDLRPRLERELALRTQLRGLESRFGGSERTGTRMEETMREADATASAQRRIAEAYGQSEQAGRRAEAVERALAAVRKTGSRNTDEESAAVVRLAEAYADEARARSDVQSRQAERGLRQEVELLQAQTSLLGASVEVRERELAALRARQQIEARGGDVASAASQSYIAAAQAAAGARLEQSRLAQGLQEIERIGEQAFERIGTAITQAFASGELRTIRFGSIAKAVASEVGQYFAKIAIVNPILNAVFGGNRTTISDLGGIVGTLFGGSGSGGAGGGTMMLDGMPLAAYAPLGEGVSGPVLSLPAGVSYSVLGSSGIGGFGSGLSRGGGMGIAQLLGLAGSGGSIINNLGGGSVFSGAGRYLGLTGEGGLLSGVGTGVSNFLATPLWTYGNLSGATNSALANMGGAYGPATPAQVAAEGAGVATVGQVAGGVLGIAGGAYGIYSGIQKGGVGGAFQVAGGAVGVAAGASSLLAAAGIIGASLGPIGWIAAAVLAVIGALLPGQKASNREGNATFDFVTGATTIGGQTGSKYSQANRDSANSLLKGVVDITTRLERTLGLQFNQTVTVGVGDRDGLFYQVTNPGSAAGRDALGKILGDAGAGTAFGRYGRSDQGAKDLARDLLATLVRQSAADLPAAAMRLPLQGMKWPSLEEGLQQIQALVEATNRGRPSANQNIAAANIDWTDFANGVADLKWVAETYDVMTGSQTAAAKFEKELQKLNDSFDEAAERAARLGLSEQAVNDARARNIQALTDRRDLEGLRLVSQQQNTLTSFLDNLTYQNATPAERLQLAQEAFGSALARAREGDIRTADLSSVTQSAGSLLEAGRAFYATGPGAADLERFVRSSIENLGAQLQLPAFGGDLALSLESAINPLKDELQLLRDEVTALREELRTSRLRVAA